MPQVCALLKYLLTLIDKNDINYADVDDIFARTTVQAPDPAKESRIPMYAPPSGFKARFTVPRRHLPVVRPWERLLPNLQTAVGDDETSEVVFTKTYQEHLGHWYETVRFGGGGGGRGREGQGQSLVAVGASIEPQNICGWGNGQGLHLAISLIGHCVIGDKTGTTTRCPSRVSSSVLHGPPLRTPPCTLRTLLRLFFFVFHAHWVLFFGCLLLVIGVDLEIALWALSATEVCPSLCHTV